MLPYLHSKGGISRCVSPFAIDISLYHYKYVVTITTLPTLFLR